MASPICQSIESRSHVRIATLQSIIPFIATFWPTECLVWRALCPPRVVLRGEDIRTRPWSPLRCPFGDQGLNFDVRSRPQLGTGDFRRSRRGPQARGGGLGNAPGLTTADLFRENQDQPRRQQSNRAGLLSVGFPTCSIRMQAAWLPCNTRLTARSVVLISRRFSVPGDLSRHVDRWRT